MLNHQLIAIDENIEEDTELRAMVSEGMEPHRGRLSQTVRVTTMPLHRATSLDAPMDDLLLAAICEIAATDITFSNGWRYAHPSCGVALFAAYLVGRVRHVIVHWAFLLALLVGLVPIGRRAIVGALAGSPLSIETLMSIAVIGAVIIGATEEVATVVLLFLVGELLEGIAASRARASIKGLADLVPKTALLVDGDDVREVLAAGQGSRM